MNLVKDYYCYLPQVERIDFSYLTSSTLDKMLRQIFSFAYSPKGQGGSYCFA